MELSTYQSKTEIPQVNHSTFFSVVAFTLWVDKDLILTLFFKLSTMIKYNICDIQEIVVQ